ncbi:MAG: hypothetical protein JWP97_2685 [Labilithrix sp.]|nr:hypothetical protein [Labilithrix sp.]
MRTAVAMLTLVVGLPAFACERTTPDTGRDALLQVQGGSFFREPLPPDEAGPRVLSLTLAATLAAGQSGQGAAGEGERPTRAFAFAVGGDVGYWIVPAGIPSISAASAPTYEISYAIGRALAPGPHEFVVRAVDEEKRFGPPLVRPFTVTAPRDPSGALVVSLRWENGANLDLHVIDPSGTEIFKRNINSYSSGPPGSAPDAPGAPHDGGVLDLDSNAGCVYDGRSVEHVVWEGPPPRGHYLVRVDTFSLCGEPVARWEVEALLGGVRIGAAQGYGTVQDTKLGHDRGAGVLALEIDVP